MRQLLSSKISMITCSIDPLHKHAIKSDFLMRYAPAVNISLSPCKHYMTGLLVPQSYFGKPHFSYNRYGLINHLNF